ncbi:MAG: acyltransferase [Candidatus Accumulibacter phosphatis]|uniref:acyltransferase n=1 Tax=Candidatus Accumulibacter phosphatis TaxID=327160 RepID=UPI001A445AE3|nr:acyltransferase [Candidatus Accumulibacter phosphatis]
MRRIKPLQIVVFAVLLGVALILSVITAWASLGQVPLGDFRGVVLTLLGVIMLYVYSIIFYRLFLKVFPLHAGEIVADSQQEFVYHVYILFYLLLFYPVMRSGFMPAPLMRAFYLALGTRLGENTYTQGILHDPPFIEIGRDSVVGQYAILVPHVIEGSRLAHHPIRVGNNVTIGAHASVLSDVTIGDGAIVATGAVVRKGTHIGAGEIWGGVPAARIGRIP